MTGLKVWHVVVVFIVAVATGAFAAAAYFAVQRGKDRDVASAERQQAVNERARVNAVLIKQTRKDLCKQVDADHNRARAEIVKGQYLLYTVDSFKALVATPHAEHVAYSTSKQRYYDIRSTRPGYCTALVGPNKVPKFPSLASFRTGHPPKGNAETNQRGSASSPSRNLTRSRTSPTRPSSPVRRPRQPTPIEQLPGPTTTPAPAPSAPAPQPQNPHVPDRVCVNVPLLAPVCVP